MSVTPQHASMSHQPSSRSRRDVLIDAAELATGIALLPFLVVCWGYGEIAHRIKRKRRSRRIARENEQAAERRLRRLLENAPQPLPVDRARRLSTLPARTTQTQCNFLTRLPLEVRQEVYTYVLGGNLAHVVCKDRRLAHVRCKDNRETDFVRCCRFATVGTCHDRASQLASTSNGNVALLRSCIQVYMEAVELLYYSNTFDFDHQDLFLFFTRSILPPRLALIKHVHLNLAIPKTRTDFLWGTNGWCLMWQVIGRDLPGLRHLRVRLVGWTGERFPSVDEWWMESILGLRNLKTFSLEFDPPSNIWSEFGPRIVGMSALLDDHIRGIVCSGS